MKLIQVGMGGMGNAWINTVRATPDAELVAFVEISDSIVNDQCDKHGFDRGMVYPTLEHALSWVTADGVINVTPPQFHREVSVTALEAGVPVLSEKPLAHTMSDAKAIVDAANKTGVLHMVAQNYRYSVPAQTLKRVLSGGELGRVGSVSIEFFRGPHFGGFREEMPYPLIVDMAIHHFDMLRFFLDSDPVSVVGRSWNPPWSWYRGDACASVLFTFPEQVATYNGSWCSQGRETTWNGNWRFECERGVVALVDDKVMIHRVMGVEHGSGYRPTLSDSSIVPPVDMPHVTQAYLLREFIDAVTTGTPPATTCQDNIRSLAMVFDTIAAFEQGAVSTSPR